MVTRSCDVAVLHGHENVLFVREVCGCEDGAHRALEYSTVSFLFVIFATIGLEWLNAHTSMYQNARLCNYPHKTQ